MLPSENKNSAEQGTLFDRLTESLLRRFAGKTSRRGRCRAAVSAAAGKPRQCGFFLRSQGCGQGYNAVWLQGAGQRCQCVRLLAVLRH